MADEAVTTVENDNPQGTVQDTALTSREADERIAALFGNPQEDNPDTEEGTEADTPPTDPDDDGDEPDVQADPEDDSEDSDDAPAENDDKAPDYAEGRFAADNAKVKWDDGTTTSIAELKQGYLRQSDYSRKTAETAEVRKAIEAKETEFSQRLEQLEREREFTLEYAKAIMPPEPEMPKVSATVDPVAWAEYSQKKAERDNLIAWNSQLEEHRAATAKKQQEEATENAKKALVAEQAVFFDAFPKLKDNPAETEKFWNKIDDGAVKYYGIPKGQAKGLDKTVMVRILNDAIKYQRLQEKAPEAQKRVEAKPQLVADSGKRNSPQANERRARASTIQTLRETGNVRDADNAILAFLSRK